MKPVLTPRGGASGGTVRVPRGRVSPDGTFEGYASLFGVPDQGGDVVMPGAFRETLLSRGASGIRMLFQHDPGQPIGVWEDIREDSRGLFVRGRLVTDVVRAREVLSLMRGGALDGLSIGFRTLKGYRDPRSGVRRLLKIDLWEISVVTFPMLSGARVSAVKLQTSPRQVAERLRSGAARLNHGRRASHRRVWGFAQV